MPPAVVPACHGRRAPACANVRRHAARYGACCSIEGSHPESMGLSVPHGTQEHATRQAAAPVACGGALVAL